jgi:hypothetical protein
MELDQKSHGLEIGIVDGVVAALAERLRICRILTIGHEDFGPLRVGDASHAAPRDRLVARPASGSHTTAGSSGVPDHLGARFSQPFSVTATVSSWRMPSSP